MELFAKTKFGPKNVMYNLNYHGKAIPQASWLNKWKDLLTYYLFLDRTHFSHQISKILCPFLIKIC